MKTTDQHADRFDSDASRYAEYLDSSEGKLRTELTLANLQDFLPIPGTISLHALDIGCGTAAASIRLAQLGVHVTALDSSPAMLEFAQQKIVEARVGNKISLKQGNARELANMFPPESFDVVLCHNLLEYVDDPNAVLHAAARMMRSPSAILSILVRSQAGEVMKAALQTGDLAAAEHDLEADWGLESLYGGKVRLFTFPAVALMLGEASLTVTARRGVRILSDYLPTKISRSAEYQRILALERKLSTRREFFGVARYLHCVASREALETGDTE